MEDGGGGEADPRAQGERVVTERCSKSHAMARQAMHQGKDVSRVVVGLGQVAPTVRNVGGAEQASPLPDCILPSEQQLKTTHLGQRRALECALQQRQQRPVAEFLSSAVNERHTRRMKDAANDATCRRSASSAVTARSSRKQLSLGYTRSRNKQQVQEGIK